MDAAFEPPSGMPPWLRALLGTTHERHVDMVNLVSGLPDGALDWRPFPDSASLCGLALHILDVEEYLASVVRGEPIDWAGENGSRMDESLGESDLVAEIERVEAVFMAAFERAGDSETWSGPLVEDLDHVAMHYGQMQITRHAWETAHPEDPGAYVHWR